MKVDKFVDYWEKQLLLAEDNEAFVCMFHQNVKQAIAIIESQRAALKSILEQEGWEITCCETAKCGGCEKSSEIARRELEKEV